VLIAPGVAAVVGPAKHDAGVSYRRNPTWSPRVRRHICRVCARKLPRISPNNPDSARVSISTASICVKRRNSAIPDSN
jgi:hypothetical protein